MSYCSIKLVRSSRQIETSSKRSKLDGRGFFRYTDRDSPSHKPQYGNTYSARQIAIIEGQIPLDDIRLNELTLLMRKAGSLGDIEIQEQIGNLRLKKMDPNYYEPNISIEDARRILEQLTPQKANDI